ncbi:hypothetical protein [Streptomyces sp. SP18CS02]|uniref:hypothetical protein n=1 Tax=Streptomyces sp. SP18CS02 TaxID=3002531 RepID=UPI002E798D55|nr:hypothetical protein [Streptomyces sp. SP18CS02]MEE1754819.1 hypothetical protein [Streptomyces sp. SP18CS02]
MRDAGREPGPGRSVARASAVGALVLYGLVTGTVAVGAGAASALLVPGPEARLVVWPAVSALVAVAAGLWWGLTPAGRRSRVLGRLLDHAPDEERR